MDTATQTEEHFDGMTIHPCSKCELRHMLFEDKWICYPRYYTVVYKRDGTSVQERLLLCLRCASSLKMLRYVQEKNITDRRNFLTWDSIYYKTDNFDCMGKCKTNIQKRHTLSMCPSGFVEGYKNFLMTCLSVHIVLRIT